MTTGSPAEHGEPRGATGSPAAVARPRAPRRWSLDVTRIVSITGVVAIHVFGAMVSNESIRCGGA